MKKLITLLVAVGIAFGAVSQVTYQKVLDDGGKIFISDMASTNNGFVATGIAIGYGQGGFDVLIAKFNKSGELVWARVVGGSGSDRGNAIAVDNDGNYIVGGETSSFGQGNTDMYIVKMDSLGNLLWTKTFGTNNSEAIAGIEIGSNGNYYFSGKGALDGLCLIQLDNNGNTIWSKFYSISSNQGGVGRLYKMSNGDFILFGGNRISTFSLSNGYIARITPAGIVKWSTVYTTSNLTGVTARVDDVKEIDNGGIVASIYYIGGGIGGSQDFSIVKIDSSGNEIWRRLYGTNTNEQSPSLFVKENSYVVVGQNSTNIIACEIEPNGNILNSISYGNSGEGFTASMQSNDKFIIAGTSTTLGNGAYIIQTDSSLMFPNCYVTPTVLTDSILVGTGQIVSTIVIDTILTDGNGGIVDTLFNVTDSSLCYQYLGCTDTAAENYNPDATVDDGSCIIDGTGRTPELGTEIKIFPNPTNGELRIDLKDFKYKVYDVKMYDQKGVEVYSRSMTDSPNKPLLLKLDNANFRAGTYVVLISTEKGSIKRKLIISAIYEHSNSYLYV